MSTEVLTIAPNAADWEQVLNEETFSSLSGAMQSSARTGNRWRLVLTYRSLTESRRTVLMGHLAQLRGTLNRLQVNMSSLAYVRGGAGGGTPLLVGTHSAGATSLSIDGASNHATWLKAGDWISVGNELKMVTQNVTTTATAGTIPIWPELHQNRADNFAIDISTPKGVFYLKNPGVFSIQPGATDWMTDVVIALEEDVLA